MEPLLVSKMSCQPTITTKMLKRLFISVEFLFGVEGAGIDSQSLVRK